MLSLITPKFKDEEGLYRDSNIAELLRGKLRKLKQQFDNFLDQMASKSQLTQTRKWLTSWM